MIVSWMTTNNCNLNCNHCYQDAEPRGHRQRALHARRARELIDEHRARRLLEDRMIFSGRRGLSCAPTSTSWWRTLPRARACAPCSAPTARSSRRRWPQRLKEAGACRHGHQPVDSLDAVKHDRVPRARGRLGGSRWRASRACRAGGPAVPAAHHRAWTGTADEVCDITDFAVAERRHGALRVLPDPGGARQVHPGRHRPRGGRRTSSLLQADHGASGLAGRPST